MAVQASCAAPHWPADGAALTAAIKDGAIHLTWKRAVGGEIIGYDIYRAEDDGHAGVVEAVKAPKFTDRVVLGGLGYTYHVMGYDKSGRHTAPSNTVVVQMPFPDFKSTNMENSDA